MRHQYYTINSFYLLGNTRIFINNCGLFIINLTDFTHVWFICADSLTMTGFNPILYQSKSLVQKEGGGGQAYCFVFILISFNCF